MKSRLLSMLLTGVGLAIGLLIAVQIAQSISRSGPGTEMPDPSEPADLNRTVAPTIFKTISEQNGMLRLSGTSEPDAVITLRDKGESLRQIRSNSDGNWSTVISVNDSDLWVLDVLAFVQSGMMIRSDETVYRIPPKISDPAADGGSVNANRKLSALIMVTAPGGPSRIIQSPFGNQPKAGGLSMGPLDYDASGSVIFSGSSATDGVVRIFVNGEIVGQRPVSANGRWYSIAAEALPPGQYDIRAELQDRDGGISSIVVPFTRKVLGSEGSDINDALVDVAYGAQDWQISRLIHGGGRQVTAIFAPPQDMKPEKSAVKP